ncbi:hypothetical protein ACOQFV_02945 [Nocardiopsis changdeensis]|uniref:HTH cro/C1-type domain-containing protein n=1 Tax=Nocardiopsis changdeensis TaxID=2831969 RepID=A0ABX8BNF0_9ACTN|nr:MULTISPECIES: hypothetical protein [Nocardiopsis]QUX22582.1 hypothetical protein KGD84_30520 [Nocardiopsis changdeensis]QYX38523.1 hypothetical protein K1J57_07900 [Nocardiopsis sp. MT53]
MSSRFSSLARATAGASAVAVLAVLASPAPSSAAAGEEVCAHVREDGSCALVLTGGPAAPALRADGPWLEVPGRDPDCRTGEGVPVEVFPGDDGVFHLAPGEGTVFCDVTAQARGGEAAGPSGAAEAAEWAGSGGAPEPGRSADPSGAAGTPGATGGGGVPGTGGGTDSSAVPEPVDRPGAAETPEAPGTDGRSESSAVPGPVGPSGTVEAPGTAGDGDAPEASPHGEHGGAPGEGHSGTPGEPGGEEAPADPAPSASPSPECLGNGEEHEGSREWQRFPVERTGPCRGTPLAQWPDLEAAAGQAGRLAFVDLADRLGVSVFDLAEHLGVDGVRGLSRRSVDELAGMLGITPQDLVDRSEEAAAAIIAAESSSLAGGVSSPADVASSLAGGASPSLVRRSGGLFGRPDRLPDTGPRAAVLVHGGVLLTAAGALVLLLARRLPS